VTKNYIELELIKDHWAVLTKDGWQEFQGKGKRFRFKSTDPITKLALESGAFKEIEGSPE